MESPALLFLAQRSGLTASMPLGQVFKPSKGFKIDCRCSRARPRHFMVRKVMPTYALIYFDILPSGRKKIIHIKSRHLEPDATNGT